MTKPSPVMMIEAIGSIFQQHGSKSFRMFDLVRTRLMQLVSTADSLSIYSSWICEFEKKNLLLHTFILGRVLNLVLVLSFNLNEI